MEYNQPTGTICQVGITVFNVKTKEVQKPLYWNIKMVEPISPYITKLCGISQEDIDNGISLQECYEKIKSLSESNNCFRNCLTWGGGDSQDLRKALNLDEESFLFGRRWIDAKTLFISYCIANNLKTQSGLAKSLIRLGLAFQGRKHNAGDDSYNTAVIYLKLLEKLKEKENA